MPDNSRIYDLVVIGAGPAGASAAISAAQTGARVLLLERGRFPRHKVCGEFVSAESLGLLSNSLAPEHKRSLDDAIRIPRTRIFLDGRTVQASIDPPAASFARFDLDIALWQSAEKLGVDARSQVTVNKLDQRTDGMFVVNTSAGEFEAKALVNATGRWSNLTAKPPDNDGTGVKWLGVKGHFSEPSPANSVDLYFFEGGYCGVQPVDLANPATRGARVNACAMIRADVASSLAEVFAKHPALRERSQDWKSLSDPVSTSPLIFRNPQPVRDGVLMAGDAAAFVDPFVGDGISLALRSGGLAAECLVPYFQGSNSLQQTAQIYLQKYIQKFKPIFSTSSRIRQMLTLPKHLRAPLLFMLERNPALTRYLVKKTR
ncbi:MAG TPA: NAD(P)/FAD-dependent oxidoreductase [Terriglobales bacterium]|nr:NAD(P)/FAD-dependent oxidoreductase [Terriglobales bacterium]